MSCPNCGAPGGGPSGCGSCGLGKDPNVGGAFDAGQDELRQQQNSQKDNGCFPGDSLVLTPFGYKILSELRKGDIVCSLDDAGQITPVNIKRLHSHRPHRLVSVKSSVSGLSFKVTKLHPVQTTKGWVPVNKLKVGVELIYVTDNAVQKTHTIESIDYTEDVEPVYNLIVDGNHTFIVKGCVAHCFVSFRKFRCLLSKYVNAVRYPFQPNPSPA